MTDETKKAAKALTNLIWWATTSPLADEDDIKAAAKDLMPVLGEKIFAAVGLMLILKTKDLAPLAGMDGDDANKMILKSLSGDLDDDDND